MESIVRSPTSSTAKTDVSFHINDIAKIFQNGNIEEYFQFDQEVMKTKTEVKEELYDFEMIENELELAGVQEMDTIMYDLPPEDVMILKPKEELSSEDFRGPELLGLQETDRIVHNLPPEDAMILKPKEELSSEDFGLENGDFVKIIFTIEEYNHKCDACHLEFEKEEYLGSHHRICPYKKETLSEELTTIGVNLVCAFCNVKMFEEKPYRQHVELCRDSYLRLRIKEETSKIPNVFKCTKCPYTTNRQFSLVRHYRVHSNDKPFKCEMCKRLFSQKDNLKRHILQEHSSEEKKYKCGDCGYSTHIKEKLTLHIHTHTKERPYKIATTRKCILRNHVLVKHGGKENRFKCGRCEYSTHIEAYLSAHNRVHTEEKPHKCKNKKCKWESASCANVTSCVQEKPFRCDKCDYFCAYQSHLRYHIKRKHLNTR